jgi:hypothetical protein
MATNWELTFRNLSTFGLFPSILAIETLKNPFILEFLILNFNFASKENA